MYKTDVGVRIVLSPISWYVIIMSFLVSANICDLCGIGDTYILFITKEAQQYLCHLLWHLHLSCGWYCVCPSCICSAFSLCWDPSDWTTLVLNFDIPSAHLYMWWHCFRHL
jgi:hypothetical protein